MREMAVCVALCAFCFSSSAGEPTYEQAVELLRQSETDRSKIVEAARALTSLAERTKDPHINSLLYWVKKRMTIKEAQQFAATDPYAAKVSDIIVETSVEKSEAKEWLRRADEFALVNSDPLLKAIRYYEVASRFSGTPASLIAQEKSLKYMRQVSSSSARITDVVKQPQAKLTVVFRYLEFEVYIDSKRCGLTAPCSIELPAGRYVVSLVRDGFRDQSKVVTITKDLKPVTITFGKPYPGISRVLINERKEVMGDWVKTSTLNLITLKPDMTFKVSGPNVHGDAMAKGTWTMNGKQVRMEFHDGPVWELELTADGELRGNWRGGIVHMIRPKKD